MPIPHFTISADGKDVTQNFVGAGITMTITDNEGLKSDTLQIVIDDVEGSVEAPRTGATINPKGGYLDGEMRDFGLFIVDSVTFSGWPQQISIDAKAVEAKSLAKQRDPKAYPKKDFPTYGDIISDVAGRVGLKLKISDSIKAKANEYEAQADENSLEFLTRIGENLDATITVKAGNLIVVEKGEGKSASGGELPTIKVARSVNLLKYSATEKDEPKHSEVEGSYYDRKANKKVTVEASTGLDGPTFRLRSPYQDEASAKKAAEAKAKTIKRDIGEASFDIDGNPSAQAEAMVEVSGCRSNVDGTWRAKTVTHQFSSDAPYTTSISCTKPTSKKSGGGSGSSIAGGGSSQGASGAYIEAGTPEIPGNVA